MAMSRSWGRVSGFVWRGGGGGGGEKKKKGTKGRKLGEFGVVVY